MSERRITAEEVVQAYRESGRRPKRCTIWDTDTVCCALGALAAVAGIGAKNPVEGERRLRWATETFGDDYARAFIFGFDEGGMYYKDAEACPEGCMDGEKALEACRREFGDF